MCYKTIVFRSIALLPLFAMLALFAPSSSGQSYSERNPYTYTVEEVEKGGFMLLVNKTYRLPDGYKPPNLQRADTRLRCERENMFLNAVALDHLERMFTDAKKEGIDLIFFDGWREEALQRKYYDDKIAERGHSLATTLVAPPRGSEHELGLAADILSTVHRMRDGHFALTSTGKWLIANCWKYGFILRYPSNKIEITRFLFEPWHYRFVGVEEAKKITESGLCLEEYLGKK
ncbi:MAG: M15 family metallopeptidase [Bacteroidales bacterium]|nr:M15 family metallopeptidase [Bacteroidales bacterium]